MKIYLILISVIFSLFSLGSQASEFSHEPPECNIENVLKDGIDITREFLFVSIKNIDKKIKKKLKFKLYPYSVTNHTCSQNKESVTFSDYVLVEFENQKYWGWLAPYRGFETAQIQFHRVGHNFFFGTTANSHTHGGSNAYYRDFSATIQFDGDSTKKLNNQINSSFGTRGDFNFFYWTTYYFVELPRSLELGMSESNYLGNVRLGSRGQFRVYRSAEKTFVHTTH